MLTKLWGRINSAHVIALAALFVALAGSAYALEANSVGTRELKDAAVTPSKIKKKAVKAGKIAPAAVKTGRLANRAVTKTKVDGSILTASTIGVPLAGANVAADGTLNKSFNRLGGPPTVSHTANSGIYTLTFPGLEGRVLNSNSIALASLTDTAGEIARSSGSGNPRIFTSNSAGAASDRAFQLVIFVPGG